MTLDEVYNLLTLIAARDNRSVGQGTALAWQDDIGDLDFDDCHAAVRCHFRESTDWLMPAHIRRIVKRLRDERLANSDLALPTADPADEETYRQALVNIRRRIGDGQPLPFRAIEAGHSEPSTEFRETRDDLAARRKDNALAKARDAQPDGETCDDCGALRDPDGICRACQTWTASS
jgi:hypothetical protein